MKNPAKLALTKGGIIPGNHTDKGPDPTPEDQRPYTTAMDAMSRALRRAARSPFPEEIERAPMPNRFT